MSAAGFPGQRPLLCPGGQDDLCATPLVRDAVDRSGDPLDTTRVERSGFALDASQPTAIMRSCRMVEGTAMSEFRVERDSMGDVQVPALAYYGAQTQRAVENFPISGWPLPPALVHAMGLVKYACAVANRDLGKLTGSGKNPLSDLQVEALLAACREVSEGKLDGEFPVDMFQTGSGTSSNMNVNEVIANRAIEILGGDRFATEKPIHPNDHVNMGQSTNDTFPTAIHVAVAVEIQQDLIPALERLQQQLAPKPPRGTRSSRSAAPT